MLKLFGAPTLDKGPRADRCSLLLLDEAFIPGSPPLSHAVQSFFSLSETEDRILSLQSTYINSRKMLVRATL